MSAWSTTRPPEMETSGQRFASGPLSEFGDVSLAAYREARVTTNLNAEQIAGEVIFDDVIGQVQKATGDNLQNPYRLSFRERWIDTLGPSLRSPYNPRRLGIMRARDEFMTQYWKLQKQQLDMGVPFDQRLPDFDFETRLRELVRERQARLEDVKSRASGFDSVIGSLAGGVGAAGTDPVTYATAFVPLGEGGSLLNVAVREAIANAAVEAALQPSQFAWHERLGLEYTPATAATNIAIAGAFGGLMGVSGSAAKRGLVGSPEFREARALVEQLPEDHVLRQSLSGKRKDVIAAAKKLRSQLTPEGKFALERAEAAVRSADEAPEGVSAPEHERALSESERAADGETPSPSSRPPAETSRGELEPYLGDDLAYTEQGRMARDLTHLSDAAYDMVREGRISFAQGALISRLVPDASLHAVIARDLGELGTLTPEQSRVAIAAGIEAQAPDAVARAIGWEGPAPSRPQSLIDWIRARGGIRTDKFMTGDIRAILGGDGRSRPGLMNEKSGIHMDELARYAVEAGFDVGDEDPGILARLIQEELGGNPTFRIGEMEEWQMYRDAADRFGPAEMMRQAVSEMDPARDRIGETFGDQLGDFAPEDGPAMRAREEAPAREIPDHAAEADAIDEIVTGGGERARIRDEAVGTFGEKAARVIADDPSADVNRPYLFRRTEGDAPVRQGWLTPLGVDMLKEDAAVFRAALEEAAACAASIPLAENTLTAAGVALGAAAGSKVIADGQARAAEDDRISRARRAFRQTDLYAAQQAAKTQHEMHKRLAGFRTEAHAMASRVRHERLSGMRANLETMPAMAPQFQVNSYTEELTGVRGDYLDTLIGHEAAGDWQAQNPDSSAFGGAQFIDSTWRRMMREHGESYGLKLNPRSRKAEERQAILDLRADRRWGTIMAAEYAKENAGVMERALGRAISQKEAYLGHFLGAYDAVKLLRADPEAIAADLLPDPAAANFNVFYMNGDAERPRTAAQVIALQGRRFSNDPLIVPDWTDPRERQAPGKPFGAMMTGYWD